MSASFLAGFIYRERTVQFLVFLAVFSLMAFWEVKSSWRVQKTPRKIRWTNNLAVSLLNALVVRVIFPGSTLWAAYWAFNHRYGFFNLVEVPYTFSVILTIINLDWAIYYQHRAFHALPLLWKFHRVHHSDLELDASTGLRFHPVEMLLSTCLKSLVIVILGAPPGGVFLFELLFNSTAIFNHANIRLPEAIDEFLRIFFVTPDLHRVHHSSNPKEFGRNFGFIFSWWDKFFGTYLAQPERGLEQMTVGLDLFNDPQFLMGDKILLQPFMDKQGQAAWGNLTRQD